MEITKCTDITKANDLTNFINEVFKQTFENFSSIDRTYPEFVEAVIEEGNAFIGKFNNEIVGFLKLSETGVKKYQKTRKYTEIGMLAVKKSYQKRGFGAQLLEFGVQEAKRRGKIPCIVQVEIPGDEIHQKQIKWYTSYGWQILDRKWVDSQEVLYDDCDVKVWVVDRVDYKLRGRVSLNLSSSIFNRHI